MKKLRHTTKQSDSHRKHNASYRWRIAEIEALKAENERRKLDIEAWHLKLKWAKFIAKQAYRWTRIVLVIAFVLPSSGIFEGTAQFPSHARTVATELMSDSTTAIQCDIDSELP